MKRHVKQIIGTLLLLLLLPSAVLAAGQEQDEPEPTVINSDITVNSDYDIDENTIINGQVTVLDGELDLEGTVNGDVTVFGGSVDMKGTVNGALVVIGGELQLDEAAVIDGECAVIGGTVETDGVTSPCTNIIAGEFGLDVIQGFANGFLSDSIGSGVPNIEITPPDVPTAPQAPDAPPMPEVPEFSDMPHTSEAQTPFFLRFLNVLGRSLLAGGLGFLIAVLLPQRLVEVTDAVERKPAAAGTIGFFTAIAALSILVLSSIIWVPVLAVLALICGLGILLALGGVAFMGGTVLMGWTAVGVLVGERIAHSLKIEKPGFAAVAAIGSAAITLGVGLLGLVPFTPDILLGLVIMSIGLGGVVLTRFGAQPYPLLSESPDKINRLLRNMPDESDTL